MYMRNLGREESRVWYGFEIDSCDLGKSKGKSNNFQRNAAVTNISWHCQRVTIAVLYVHSNMIFFVYSYLHISVYLLSTTNKNRFKGANKLPLRNISDESVLSIQLYMHQMFLTCTNLSTAKIITLKTMDKVFFRSSYVDSKNNG